MHATMLHNAMAFYIQQRIFPTYRYIYKVITLLKVIVMWGLKYDRGKKSKDCKVCKVICCSPISERAAGVGTERAPCCCCRVEMAD